MCVLTVYEAQAEIGFAFVMQSCCIYRADMSFTPAVMSLRTWSQLQLKFSLVTCHCIFMQRGWFIYHLIKTCWKQFGFQKWKCGYFSIYFFLPPGCRYWYLHTWLQLCFVGHCVMQMSVLKMKLSLSLFVLWPFLTCNGTQCRGVFFTGSVLNSESVWDKPTKDWDVYSFRNVCQKVKVRGHSGILHHTSMMQPRPIPIG